MNDSHIHIGQFYNIYTSPKQLVDFLNKVGVDKFAVSSTTICEANYEKVINELTELEQLAGNRAIPVLWVLPQMLEDEGLALFLDSSIKWKCIKIHPQLHPNSWMPRDRNMKRIIQLATEINCPVLIHTGEMSCCHAGLFKNLALYNPNVRFILAHGRPLDETIDVMKSCNNVYTDTAFMPLENVACLCKNELVNRVLWGTDYPVPKYYYQSKDIQQYYHTIVSDLRKKIETSDFEKIIKYNFDNIFE